MFVLSRNGKGVVAELEIATAAARLGVGVLRPVSEHSRCDLAFEIGRRVWRVQCKWGRLDRAGEVVIVKTGGSRCAPNGYVRTTYAEHEVDLFGIYCGELDRAFCFPRQSGGGQASDSSAAHAAPQLTAGVYYPC